MDNVLPVEIFHPTENLATVIEQGFVREWNLVLVGDQSLQITLAKFHDGDYFCAVGGVETGVKFDNISMKQFFHHFNLIENFDKKNFQISQSKKNN